MIMPSLVFSVLVLSRKKMYRRRRMEEENDRSRRIVVVESERVSVGGAYEAPRSSPEASTFSETWHFATSSPSSLS